MIIYCISGLGADERVFARLRLQAELRHLPWLKPYKQEVFHDYCKRLAEQIDASRPFALLGVSFGGLVAQELAQLLPARKVIIISSFSQTTQLPFLARIPLLAAIVGILPRSMLVPPQWLGAWFFGITQPEERKLLAEILADTDTHFLRWALQCLLRLRKIPSAGNLLHLHGTADRLIACPAQEQVVKIKRGGHFMIYNCAAEVSAAINHFLKG